MTLPFKRVGFSLLILFSATCLYAQPTLYGVAPNGGSEGLGTIYKADTSGNVVEAVRSFFPTAEGTSPTSNIIEGSDGWYYGSAASGGSDEGGTIFRFNLEGDFEVLHNLSPSADGSSPEAAMLETSPGEFLGTCRNGGENSSGTIYSFSLEDGFEVIHHFSAANDGSNPAGSLIPDGDGNWLGTCSSGGADGFGTIYRLNSDQSITVVHEFDGESQGGNPKAGLVQSSGGDYYGTCHFGGDNSQGTIYRIDSNEDFEVVHQLDGATSDGRYPRGKLQERESGVLYGLCAEGGTNNGGTIFTIDESGVFNKIHDFIQPIHGGLPVGHLELGDNNNLYGLCQFGGANSFGTLFKVDETNTFTTLVDMNYSTTGANPIGGVLSNGQGQLLGAIQNGGLSDAGTIISYSIDEESVDKIRDLSRPLQGSQPLGGLNWHQGMFYGTAQFGGEFNGGVIFRAGVNGEFEILHEFNSTEDGRNPQSELVFGPDGTIYGTAQFGGENESGTIFKWSEDDGFETLHHFESSTDGTFPYCGLLLAEDGNLYGLTHSGGSFNRGTVFSITTSGDFNVIKQLNPSLNGGNPFGRLVQASDGLLYGTCREGGSFNSGVVFRTDYSGDNYEVVKNLNPFTDGRYPEAGLTVASDGNLYGVTTAGGENNHGTLFRLTTDGTLTLLENFDSGTSGRSPQGELVELEGILYGNTNQGGANGFGTVYEYRVDNEALEVLHSFDNSTGTGVASAMELFIPECTLDEECSDDIACTIDTCMNGVCTYLPINPSWTLGEQTPCEPGVVYTQEITMELENNPGGTAIIMGQEVELDSNPVTFVLEDLPATGNPVDLDYTFLESGCTGTAEDLFNAPDPCESVTVTFILDLGGIEPSEQGVHVAGTFNNWDPAEFELTQDGDFYMTTLYLASGNYDYNFINGNALFDAEYVSGGCASGGKRELELTQSMDSISVSYCYGACIENCTVGFAESQSGSIAEVYPNPAREFATVVLNGRSNDYSIRLYTIEGKELNIDSSRDGNSFRIPVSNLSPGMYSVVIEDRETGRASSTPLVVNK